ncbi:MAG: glycosyltransferase [Bacteroidia bacterium]
MATHQRIVWLPRWYPNKFDPYDGNFVEAHARVASSVANIAVIFVHSDPDLSRPFELVAGTDEAEGFPVVRVYYAKPTSSIPGMENLLHVIRFRKAQMMAYRYLKANWGEADAFHIHVLSRPAILARRLRKPYFITEHASRYFQENFYFTGILRRWWTRRIVKGAKHVTTVSHALRDAMQAQGLKGHYERLSNVVRTDLFKPQKRDQDLPFRLVHVSTMHDVPKNTGGILRACASLKKMGIDFQLDLLGDGPERGKQEALAESLGLSDHVTFHGNVSLESVADFMAKAHAFVMFSWYETQSIVVLEAFSCGVPVVATPVGGLAEHLFPAYGIAVPPGDEQSLAEGIRTVLEKPQRFNAEAMRTYVKEMASPESIAERFRKLYE